MALDAMWSWSVGFRENNSAAAWAVGNRSVIWFFLHQVHPFDISFWCWNCWEHSTLVAEPGAPAAFDSAICFPSSAVRVTIQGTFLCKWRPHCLPSQTCCGERILWPVFVGRSKPSYQCHRRRQLRSPRQPGLGLILSCHGQVSRSSHREPRTCRSTRRSWSFLHRCGRQNP